MFRIGLISKDPDEQNLARFSEIAPESKHQSEKLRARAAPINRS